MSKSSMRKMLRATLVAAAFCISVPAPGAWAESLTVSPTKLTVPNPARQTTLTVKADARGPSVVQVRVYQWNEGEHPSRLRRTKDVVVSPPVVKLRSRQELTVRIVRVNKRAVRGRECYRVLVDRLPSQEQADKAVKLKVRHSVPLCFTS